MGLLDGHSAPDWSGLLCWAGFISSEWEDGIADPPARGDMSGFCWLCLLKSVNVDGFGVAVTFLAPVVLIQPSQLYTWAAFCVL